MGDIKKGEIIIIIIIPFAATIKCTEVPNHITKPIIMQNKWYWNRDREVKRLSIISLYHHVA